MKKLDLSRIWEESRHLLTRERKKPNSHRNPELVGDQMMKVNQDLPDKALKSGPGGIDLTPIKIKLQTMSAGEGIKFHIDRAELDRLQNASGFVPVITNIQPLGDLKQFLLGQNTA